MRRSQPRQGLFMSFQTAFTVKKGRKSEAWYVFYEEFNELHFFAVSKTIISVFFYKIKFFSFYIEGLGEACFDSPHKRDKFK